MAFSNKQARSSLKESLRGVSAPKSDNTAINMPNYSSSEPSPTGNRLFVCLNTFFPGFNVKSATFIISMIQIIVYITSVVLGWKGDTVQKGVGFTCALYKLGAKYTPSINYFHHYHRLVLPVFLHASVGHIFFNMFFQWFCGFKLEEHYGTKKYLILYFVSGVGGNILSAVADWTDISVGASSAIMGIFALQMFFLWEHYDTLGPTRHFALMFMILVLISTFNIGNNGTNIDNYAHLGGFITGCLLAFYYAKRPSDPNFNKKQKVALIVLGIYIAAGIIILKIIPASEMKAQNRADGCEYVLGF